MSADDGKTSGAWRTPAGQLIIRCAACGSFGHTAGQTTWVLDDAAQAGRRDHERKIAAVHDAYTAQFNRLMQQRIAGRDVDAQINKALMDYTAERTQLTEQTALLPSHKEFLDTCPWCGAAIGAEVEPIASEDDAAAAA